MIVVCPSCQRRYRHDSGSDSAAPTAHCSKCDERFPFAAPKQAYRLAEVGATPVSDGIPPGLNGSLLATATSESTNACPIVAIDVPISTPVATVSQIDIDMPVSEAPDFEPDHATRPAADAFEAEAPVSDDAEVEVDAARSAEEPGTQFPRRSRTMWESLVALLPCGIGAGMAYHFAGPWGQDPITWAALGGAVGLLLGWACLLWITRGDG